MHYQVKSGTVARLLALLLATAALSVGCSGPQPTPAQTQEPTATQTQAATATAAATATTTIMLMATEPTTSTAGPSTPQTTAQATAAGEEVTYRLPSKGRQDAPVTLIEFSDYL